MGEIPSRAQNMVDIALRNSVRLNDLIDDIHDTEALGSGEFVIEMETQPLAPLVHRALEENAQFAAHFGVQFDLYRQDEALTAKVDGRRFIQVLGNLLSNAVKFSPSGERVAIALEDIDGHARLSVRDHGPGVPEDFQHRLFEKFAQADSSNTRGAGGTGLGLSISKSIMERFGGRIGFDDPGDGGSIFFVELPIVPAAPGARPGSRA